jgi:dihydroxyacetone kinase DhaKLM complex PTS-EIIA-like component DhaM
MLQARSRIDLRSRSESISEIESRVRQLEAADGDVEVFAAEAGKAAIGQIKGIRTIAQLADAVSYWMAAAAAEKDVDKRMVMMELGSAVLSTDYAMCVARK